MINLTKLNYDGYTRLAAFLHIFDDIFTKDFCDTIINEYKEVDYVEAVDNGADYRKCMALKF